ncbi:hypothetical protein Droror1_Dr00016791 [Drosera rotundifolia]
MLEVLVKDKEMIGRNDYIGRVVFDLNEVPTRVPPDSPLAPQWYRLEDRRGEGKVKGEIMVAVWVGNQADEAFSEAWHADAASVHGEGVLRVRSKVYITPKLWYLRVNVIEAQDIVPNDKSHVPEIFVKVQVGNQVLRTKNCPTQTTNPLWNEDLVFVVAEPFEELLALTVEDRVHPSKDDVLGKLTMPVSSFEKRLDYRPVHSRWHNLEKFGFGLLEADRRKELQFSSRVHLRACLKGANGLLPMKFTKDGRGTTDAYCVAKYDHKWVRTRTILDSLNPKWNEQCTWDVYDPCTVITLGVFDNCHLGGTPDRQGGAVGGSRDSRIGKVRIRLSALESHHVYAISYPLLALQPTGVKKTGELQLAVPFTSLSLANMIYIYGRPLLPRMHYLHPFTVNQVNSLRYQAMNIVTTRLGRAESPIMSLLSGPMSLSQWFSDVCNWKNPITSVLVHVLFSILVSYPELILPTIFLYMFLIGLWNYRFRPRHQPVVLYVSPFTLIGGLYMLHHPWFRSKLPSVPNNFFKQLPPRTDSML